MPDASLHTEFLPAELAAPDEVERQIALALQSALVHELLELLGAPVAVLNHQRQIVAYSREFQRYVGIAEPSELLGIRPGEAVHCVYASVCAGGCGTSSYCATCGAANAIAESQDSGAAVEHKCPIRISASDGGGATSDIILNVRACPLRIEGYEFTLLYISDITDAENKTMVESIFYHDALNTLTGIISSYKMIKRASDEEKRERLLEMINLLSTQLVKDMKVQRVLSGTGGSGSPLLEVRAVELRSVFADMQDYFAVKAGRRGIELLAEGPFDSISLRTDPNLLYRVLMNMLLNALEASEDDDTVRLRAGREADGTLRISVWNRALIPPPVAQRMFQRFYSTKPGGGRGIGTHSMKYIGEKLLGGKVYFTSNPQEGTTFTIELPSQP